MAEERCIRCGGRPYTRHEKHPHSITFCERHSREHGPVLLERGWFTYRLVRINA